MAMVLMLCPSVYAAEVDCFGTKVGTTVSRFRDGPSWDSGSTAKAGIAGGVFCEFSLSQDVVLQPAAVFVRRAGAYFNRPSSLTGSLNEVDELYMRRDYLEFPLLFRFKISPQRECFLVVIAGPALGLVLSSVVIEDGSNLTAYNGEDGAISVSQNGHSDVAFIAGLGIARRLSGLRFGLDVMFRFGLTPVDRHVPGGSFEADGIDLALEFSF